MAESETVLPNSRTHTLKTEISAWDAVQRGEKTAEFRLNDRDFRVGDRLILGRGTGEHYTVTLHRTITHALYGPSFGIPEGYAMLSLGRCDCATHSDSQANDLAVQIPLDVELLRGIAHDLEGRDPGVSGALYHIAMRVEDLHAYAKRLHGAEQSEGDMQMHKREPHLGAIVLVNWTFWDDDIERGAEGRGTIRRDAKVPALVTKIWDDKRERGGVSVLTFPFGEDSTTLYAERGPNPCNEWSWPCK